MPTVAATSWSQASRPVEIRRIGASDVWAALSEGFADFRALRGDLLLIGLIYPAVGVIASILALNYSLLPMVFPLAAGISLLGPAVAVGFYELDRRRTEGEDPSWRHYFDVLRGPALPGVAILTGALFVLYMGWLLAAHLLYDATLGPSYTLYLDEFVRRLFTTSQGWTLIIVGNLIGALFAVAAFSISVMSFPLLVDRRVGPLTAVETSLRAVARNPGPMALWGLVVAALLVLGSIPLFVGLAVVVPVLGYATWRLYRRMVQA
jgi:uncharacterized membrane protein